MGLFDFLRFESRSRVRAVPASDPAAASMLALLWNSSGRPQYDARALLGAYSTNAQIARVVRFVARSISSVRWRAFRARDVSAGSRALAALQDPIGAGARFGVSTRAGVFQRLQEEGLITEEVVESPALDVVRQLSGGQLSEVDVRFVGQAQLELVGECFLRLIRDPAGRPNSLLILSPIAVESIPLRREDPWRIRQPSGTVELAPYEDIVFLKDANPAAPYGRGVGVFSSLASEIDTDAEAAETLRNRFKNRGLPEVLIELVTGEGGARTPVKDPEREAMETRFLQKFASGEKSGGVHFVNRQIKVTPLGAKIVDLDVVRQREAFAELVRKVRGVPPELLGQVENSNRATIEAAVGIWARYGMTPALNQWERLYATLFARLGAGDLIYLYDDPIPPNETARALIIQSAQWALSRDEIRACAGFDPTSDDVGELVAVPAGTSLEPLDSLTSLASDLSSGDEPG